MIRVPRVTRKPPWCSVTSWGCGRKFTAPELPALRLAKADVEITTHSTRGKIARVVIGLLERRIQIENPSRYCTRCQHSKSQQSVKNCQQKLESGPQTADRGPRTSDLSPRTFDPRPRTMDVSPRTSAISLRIDTPMSEVGSRRSEVRGPRSEVQGPHSLRLTSQTLPCSPHKASS